MAVYTHIEVSPSPASPWFDLLIVDLIVPWTASEIVLVLSDQTYLRINSASANFVYDPVTDTMFGTITSITRTNAAGTTIYETTTGLNLVADTFFSAPSEAAMHALVFSGADTLNGWSGNDTLAGRAGADTHNGGGGFDFASYQFASFGVTVDLGAPGNNTGEAAGDTYTSIEGLIGSNHNDRLAGDAGNNTLRGGLGDDTLIGGAGADHYDGGAGWNILDFRGASVAANITPSSATTIANIGAIYGSDLGDTINNATLRQVYGMGGNDTLYGYFEISLRGGPGDDIYHASPNGTAIYEELGEGIDIVYASSNMSVGPNIEYLIFTGNAPTWGSTTGSTPIHMVGNEAANTFQGYLGNDTLQGNGGNDDLTGGAGSDDIYGGSGDDRLVGDASFSPIGSADRLFGGDGNDTLDGTAGVDTLEGGAGDDIYDNVVYAVDVIVEAIDGGTDLISTSSSTYTIPANVEVLFISGTLEYLQGPTPVYVGSGSGNRIVGNVLGEIIAGLAGSDSISGEAGNDTIDGGTGSDSLTGGTGFDYLLGGDDDDLLFGDSHDDTLDGGSGNDTLDGGGNIDVLFGGFGADSIIGGGAPDTLWGSWGADGAADTLVGGDDSDTYFVYETSEIVIETIANTSGGGLDLVYSFSNRTLSANVDYLTLFGNNAGLNAVGGNDLDNALNAMQYVGGSGITFTDDIGNDIVFASYYADTISTGVGNDTLWGSWGADSQADAMTGGDGADTYYVQEALDTITETNASTAASEIDTVYSAINMTLGANLEYLFIYGSATVAAGNSLNNAIIGSYSGLQLTLSGVGGSDSITGGGGNDTIDGGAGVDYLTGSGGADTFSFAAGQANGDYIIDFDGAGAGALDALRFVGYGAGATFTQLNATQWVITYNGGASTETINFHNSASIHATDWLFV